MTHVTKSVDDVNEIRRQLEETKTALIGTRRELEETQSGQRAPELVKKFTEWLGEAGKSVA